MRNQKLAELLHQYFELGVAEGRAGRKHDTEAGDAQRVLSEIEAEIAAVLEDRARFPDRPDGIGNMITAHYGNLKAKAEAAEEHARRLHLEKIVATQNARRQALELAAGTHQARVTEIRNDPASYKNGKITKSAKRASDFHERSAQAILALQSEDN